MFTVLCIPLYILSHLLPVPSKPHGFCGRSAQCSLSHLPCPLCPGGGSSANTLKKVNMEKISNWDCSQKWVNVSGAAINDGHICFFEEGKSACNVSINIYNYSDPFLNSDDSKYPPPPSPAKIGLCALCIVNLQYAY